MKFKLFLAALSFMAFEVAYGQNAVEPVSDEELQRYAEMMDSIDAMRIDLLAKISDIVKKNPSNISVSRYNSLSKIAADPVKLQEANATPEELALLKQVQVSKDSGTAQINAIFKAMAKEYVGASTYNKVKKAIGEPGETKTKYEAILNKLKEDNGG